MITGLVLTQEWFAGCSKWPSGKAAASEDRKTYPLRYVEDLSDARTKPEDIWGILLIEQDDVE